MPNHNWNLVWVAPGGPNWEAFGSWFDLVKPGVKLVLEELCHVESGKIGLNSLGLARRGATYKMDVIFSDQDFPPEIDPDPRLHFNAYEKDLQCIFCVVSCTTKDEQYSHYTYFMLKLSNWNTQNSGCALLPHSSIWWVSKNFVT